MATVSRSSFKYFQRLAKRQRIEAAICKKNDYLAAHERARVSVAVDNIAAMIKNLKIDSWLKVQSDQRMLSLLIDETALEEDSRLDGCYAIKTDLPKSAVSKEVVHGRYKDLALVELAFRTCKQSFLEIRPVYVRKEETTRGHVLVVMMAYMIVKQLRSAWNGLDVTPEEGVKRLTSLTCTKMEIKNMASCWKIPRPRKELKELLDALGIIMPLALPHKDINVDTRKKLSNRRKRNIVK
jgi:transposase